jgi:4,5-dihydroxyphthalate decarboxylase
MLYDGELDALYTARMPSSFLKGDGRVKRLFENYAVVELDYYRQTQIFPIMHTIVIRREVYEANKWIAQSLTKAFYEAQKIAYADLAETAALKTMLPWLCAHLDATRRDFGDDWWPYGLEKNFKTLDTFTRYHFEQGLSKVKLNPLDLFAPESLEAFKI